MEIVEIKEKLIEACLKAGKTLDDAERDWATFQYSEDRIKTNPVRHVDLMRIKILDVSKAEKMYNDGLTLRQIAAELGVSSSIIVRKMVGAGWSVKLQEPTIKESYQNRLYKSRRLASEVHKHCTREPRVRTQNYIKLLRYIMADKPPMTLKDIMYAIMKMLMMKDKVNYRLPTHQDEEHVRYILYYHSSVFERDKERGIFQLKETE